MTSRSERGKMMNGFSVKEEPNDIGPDDDESPPPAFGPAALGLHRVGTQLPPKPTPSEPVQKLNARGMPARIRKKNRLFYDEDIITTSPTSKPSPKKTPKTPAKTPKSSCKKTPKSIKKTPKSSGRHPKTHLPSPERKTGQKIGTRLRNLLKLPKAHRWLCFEYFYSDIDKILFEGENDFMICLRESFPKLNTKKLERVQWTKIRRMMGKPRRCSQAFFNEERKELDKKRFKIRSLQQRQILEMSYKDLPNEIPLQYVIGTKVTARLRKPQDGLFTGTVEGIDLSNNTYRITFDRPKLGTHSVPDYEVLATDAPETINLSVLIRNNLKTVKPLNRRTNYLQDYVGGKSAKSGDPLLASVEAMPDYQGSALGSYPYRILELIVRIKKTLEVKKGLITKVKEFNTIAERRFSHGEQVPSNFEKKYAQTIIQLDTLNGDLQEYLNDVQLYCNILAPGPSIAAMLAPSHLREQCQVDAKEMVLRNNNDSIKDKNVIGLITDLVALLLQVKTLSESDQNAYELKVLRGTMEQIKMKLEPKLKAIFENEIEIHMLQIQMGLASKS